MHTEQFKNTGTLLHVISVLIPCGINVLSVINSLAKLGTIRGTTPSLSIPVFSPVYRITVFGTFVKTRLYRLYCGRFWTAGGGNDAV